MVRLPLTRNAMPQQRPAIAIKRERSSVTGTGTATDMSLSVAQHVHHDDSRQAEATAECSLPTPANRPALSHLRPRRRRHRQAVVVREELDDDVKIFDARAAPQIQSGSVTPVQPIQNAPAPVPTRERALAKLRLEELDLEEKQLVVKRQKLEMERTMLEME
jgi:hypothetical protein